MSFRPIALVVLAVVSADQASAGVIYDNGATARDFSAPSDLPHGFEAADDFMLSAAASTITDVHWSGIYVLQLNGQLPTDNFTVRFFEDNGGVPDNSPLFNENIGNIGRTLTGDVLFGRSVYSYQADIAPLTLSPNTKYWLSIVNDTSGLSVPFGWNWLGDQAITGGNRYALRPLLLGFWELSGLDTAGLDFQLTNDNVVPEPASIATWALLGLGVIGFRRRRKLVAEADERASR